MISDLLIQILGINRLKNIYVKYKLFTRTISNKCFWLGTFMRWKLSNYRQSIVSMKLYRPKYILDIDLTDYAQSIYEKNNVVTQADINNFLDGYSITGMIEVVYKIGTKNYAKVYPYNRDNSKLFPIVDQERIPEILWNQMIGLTPQFDYANVVIEDGEQIDDSRIAEIYAGPDGSDLDTLDPGDINPWIVANPSLTFFSSIPEQCPVKVVTTIQWWRSDGEIFEK